MTTIRFSGDKPEWVADANALSSTFAGGDPLFVAMMTSSPLAAWLCQETAGYPRDSSGNERNLTSGGGTLAQTGLVPWGVSIDLESNGYAIDDAAWMDTTTITVEALCRLDTVSSYNMILCRDGANRIFQFRTSTSAKVEAIPFVSGSPYTVTGVTSLSADTTYHLAWTHDGTRSKLYVNGSLDATGNDIGALDTGNQGIEFGKGQGAPYNGRISHVAVYATALAAGTLLAHAQIAGLA